MAAIVESSRRIDDVALSAARSASADALLALGRFHYAAPCQQILSLILINGSTD